MFEIGRGDLGFSIIYNNLKQQVDDKNKVLQQYVNTLSTTFKQNIRPQKCIISTSKMIRKLIEQINKILQETYKNFNALNLYFVHQLICQIFKIMSLTFNQFSQKFIIILKQQSIINNNHIAKLQTQKNNTFKQIQHLQLNKFYQGIKNLEEEEKKIQLQKLVMEKDLTSYLTISSVTASDAVTQLETLNKWFEMIISNTQKISQQSIYSRYQQLTLHIDGIKSPQQIKDQFFSQLSVNMKQKFIKIVMKAISQLYEQIKIKQRKIIKQQIQKNKPKLINKQIQTQIDNKIKSIQHINKQKYLLVNQLQKKNKQITILSNQINSFKYQYFIQKQNNYNLNQQLLSINQNYNKKIIQLQKLSSQYQKKCTINQQLKTKNQSLQNLINTNTLEQQQQQPPQNKQQFLQLDKMQDTPKQQKQNKQTRERASCIVSRRRTLLRDKVCINFQVENQLKQKKKQHMQLKKNMEILLSTLGSLNIINQNHQGNLDNYISQGTFIENVIQQLKQTKKNQIISTIQQTDYKDAIEQNSHKQQKNKQIKKRTKNQSEQSEISSTSEKKTDSKTHLIKLPKQQHHTIKNIISNHNIIINGNNGSQLQKLKSEFIQKLSKQKKISVSRYKNNHLLTETNDYSNECQNNEINFSIDIDNINQLKNKKKQHYYHHLLSCKQIIFEELKINKKNKNHPIKIKKQINNISYIKRNHQNKQINSKLIIQGQQIGKYTKQVFQQIHHKKQKNNNFVKEFIKEAIEQNRDNKQINKGLNIIKEVVSKQLNHINSIQKQQESKSKRNKQNNQNNLLVIKTFR